MKLPIIQIFMLGDGSVGKTSSIYRLITNKFDPRYLKTKIIDFKEKYMFHRNQEYKLFIWDTAGQEQYMSVSLPQTNKMDVIIICYDITDRRSFENVDTWIDFVKKKKINPIIVLAGNKIDLAEDRQVSYEEGKTKAAKNGFFFTETSCRTGENVTYMFEKAAKLSIDKGKDPKINICDDTIMLTPCDTSKKKRGCC